MSSAATADSGFRYKWFGVGDLNGFFGVMFDNVTVLSFMAFILTSIFGMPVDVVYTKMFPGTAFAVLVGDLIYTWMAFRLANRTKRNVTAMPLGLDTPSTIGIAFCVLGPSFKMYTGQGMDPHSAALQTWYTGMAVMMYVGILKIIFSFFGDWIKKVIPTAGLMGSLAGVAVALLGFVPIVEIMGAPIVGMIALGIVLYNFVARIPLPYHVPGVFISVVVGTLLYYPLAHFGLVGGMPAPAINFELIMGLPLPTLGFVHGLKDALMYLPIAIPFSILTVVGGINVTESARLAGDEYSTREIILTDAAATIIAGLCGGVAQTTAYIGQPAFKKMGCRAGYTLLTGLFIGLGGMLGFIGLIVAAIPKAVLAPILVFISLEMIAQAFQTCPVAHAPAVAFAFAPNIARVLEIKFPYGEQFATFTASAEQWINESLVICALGNGFILTSMLWAAFLAMMIDRKLRLASLYLCILAGLSFFGVIHSLYPDGNMYLPWNLPSPILQAVPYQFSLGYLALAALIFALSFTKSSTESMDLEEEAEVAADTIAIVADDVAETVAEVAEKVTEKTAEPAQA